MCTQSGKRAPVARKRSELVEEIVKGVCRRKPGDGSHRKRQVMTLKQFQFMDGVSSLYEISWSFELL
jgi:hypothetical protein